MGDGGCSCCAVRGVWYWISAIFLSVNDDMGGFGIVRIVFRVVEAA